MAESTIQQTFELALRHHQAGRLAEAEPLYRRVLAQQPRHADAMHFLGMIAQQAGRSDIAEDLIRRSIAINPSKPEAHNDLGIALKNEARLDEAMAAFRQAIVLRPDFVEAHSNLGVLQADKGQSDEAMASFREAIALRPNHAEAHNNLGNILKDKGQLDEAVAFFRQAIALRPNYAEAYSNLGDVLKDKGQLDDAIAAFQQAIALNPNLPEAHSSLAGALSGRGQLNEAIAAYHRAVALKADNPTTHSNLIFTLHYHPDYQGPVLAEEHRRWNQLHAEPLRKFIRPHLNNRDSERRLRIGYVSGDFGEHPVGRFLLPLLAQHDHRQFEIFCYSQNQKADSITGILRSYSDTWRQIVGLDDEETADLIRADGIDILVDLSGHTGSNRLLVFARKPSPVQVSYLGYPGTTGLSTIDYRLTDRFADPPGLTEQLHSERLHRLPQGIWCFAPPEDAPPVQPSPASVRGYVTFGSFNNYAKVTDAMLETWVRILREVPGSRLLLKSAAFSTRTACDRVAWFFNKQGVATNRADIKPLQPNHATHLALYNEMDIALDTFPYNGTTTTCDALWMGVPVITLAGQTHLSRVGVSLLSNVGLSETIATTTERYIGLAVALAQDRDRLKTLRLGLRERMRMSPLMDAKGFARDMEAAYRQMWRAWCETVPPKADPAGDSLYKSSSLMPESTIQQSFDLAVQHHHAGRLREAEQLYRQVLARQPEHADAMNFLGVIAHQTARSDMAVDLLRRSIALNPSYSGAYSNLGMVLKETGQLDEAIAVFHQAIALSPNYAEAYSNLGLALSDKGQLDEAIAAYRQAITLNPNLAGVHSNLGIALKDQGELDEAIAAFRRAIALDPSFPDAHSNLSGVLTGTGQFDEAMAAVRQAVVLDPDHAEAHHNLSLALLARGDLLRGWEEYEWRWKCRNRPPMRNFARPLWDGSALEGRSILLHTEQGFGDAIQFIRYLPLVAQRGGKIIIECNAELERLFQTVADGRRIVAQIVVQIVAWGQPLPAFDVHCPFLSLPRIFGTTLGTIPNAVPYLRADADAAENWRRRLGETQSILKVGLVWAGAAAHKNDRNRSMKFARMAPLAQLRGVRFFSLQKGAAADQAKTLPAGMELVDWTQELKDFADTAALIANLDLVIAVDTAVVHLAGAMNKPVWTLLPFVSDWRWLQDREDTPWYPSMRLFRQPSRGDWDSIILRVFDALSLWIKNRS